MAFVIAMMMFSLAGIPPLAGFFAKWYVFLAAINGNLYGLAVIGMLASVVAAFYYLRIIKVIYFDEPAEKSVLAPAAPILPRTLLLVNGLLVLGLGLMPGGLIALCLQAMRATLSF
jgi:NADH-quinone oxidoreductase subunit N